MSCPINRAKNQISFDNNKPDLAQVQVLFKSTILLKYAFSFINYNLRNCRQILFISRFSYSLRPAYLSKWLRAIAIMLLSVLNKSKSFFLIPKILSLTHLSSYFIAA